MPMADFEPDLHSVTPLEMVHASLDLERAIAEARQFIGFYNWVEAIKAEYLGVAFEGIVYVFLFAIERTRMDVDPWVWVIVGDIPPAYITCDHAKTPFEALNGYVGAMEEWVAAALQGASVAELIPVNVPPTHDNAQNLSRRLQFIDEQILPTLKSS